MPPCCCKPAHPPRKNNRLEQLSVCPKFGTNTILRSDEENRLIIELKNLVVEYIREMEKGQEKRSPLDNPEVDIAPLQAYTA
jgi:hypothetical protein